MEELLSAVRAACSPNTWSRGVELARRLAVTGVSDADGEILCRVKAAERTVPYSVRLYADDAEWDCDCGNRAACCEHVAGAVIALNKARASGQSLPEGRSQGVKLVHCFTRHRGFLSVERMIRWDETRQKPLRGSLASAVATQSEGVELSPSQQDLAVDRLLGQRSGPLHAELGVQVIKLLSGSTVELDGAPAYVSTDSLRPVAVLSEKDDGFVVALSPDPRLEEVIAPGVGRAGTNLHLLASTEAAGETWQQLPSEKVYRGADVAILVTEVLPELSKHFTLSATTDRLPKLDRNLRPRELVEVEQVGETLSVRASIVYGEPATCRIDNGRLVYLQGDLPVRNEAGEHRVAERIKARLGLTPGRRLTVSGSEATQLAVRLDRFDGEIVGRRRDAFIRSRVVEPRIGPAAIGPDGAPAMPDFVFQTRDTDGGLATANVEAVLRAWQNGDPLVPLLEGGWAPLPSDWLSRYGATLQRVFEARSEGELPPAVKPSLVELYAALDTPPPADLEPLRQLLYDPTALRAPRLPDDLTATLRPYQAEGVRWLNVLRRAKMGATLADDMGLGKTLQVICNLEGRCLVVAPTSLVFNWADEIARFRPGLKVNVYHGKGRALREGVDVTLTSYALLRLDLDSLRAIPWDIIVLDEAQAIKNSESQVAQAAYTLRGAFRVTVTGTPVENRLEELWSQFQFTNPGLLGSREQFRRRYSEVSPDVAAMSTATLRRTIAPFILRRDKKSVAADLPPRTDVILHCELDEQERTLYDALLQTTRKEVTEQLAGGGNVMKALEALLRLRQAACHRALVPGQSATNSSKLDVLCQALEEVTADGHKALVFSQWTGFLDLVEPHLRERSIPFNRLDGTTTDRAGVVRAFQEDPDGPSVMLLSLKAGGVGLNLTAADHVFLLDLWWNPAVEQQAADRAHRIGQQNPVFIHRLVSRNTVEEKILKLQESKRAVADAVLSDSHQVVGLSREDLLELLQ